MRCYYSNRVESLYERLKDNLFSGASAAPFARRLLLVASPAMRSWIQLRLAKDPSVGVSAGIDIGLIDHSIERLAGISTLFPSSFALALAIETALIEFPDKALPSHLASKLADLFRRYGVYGGDLIREWEKHPPLDGQGALWNRIFRITGWSYPVKAISQAQGEKVESVHLFAASFVPKSYLEFLERLSQRMDVYCYVLSPCRAFWCDIMGEKQQSRLLKKLIDEGVSSSVQFALEEVLAEANPLLANFGRLGREMAVLLEGYDSHPVQEYVIPSSIIDYEPYAEWVDRDIYVEETDSPISLLQGLQSDITLLRQLGDQPVDLPLDRHSIQVHCAPSRWREVQVLYNVLVDEIRRSEELGEPVSPGEIVVMAPDISAYIPYMRAVFESPESCLSLQVMDLRLPSQNTYIQAFISLLRLGKGAWENDAVLDLLDYGSFLVKQGWTFEEAATIQRWTQNTYVHWGFDPEHRDLYLKGMHCSNGMLDRDSVGTWSHSLASLSDALITKSGSNLTILEVSEAPLLGQWWQLLHKLRGALDPIIRKEVKKGEEWLAWLQGIAEQFLSPDSDEDSLNGSRILQQTLQSLFGAVHPFHAAELAFDVIDEHLMSALDNVSVTYREGNLQAVRCCSMLPMRAVPAKIIALLGMDADSFPKRNQDMLGLDQLIAQKKGDYCPRPNDFDRYLFLEALLSARRNIIFSFSGRWKHSPHSSDQLPSTLLQELVAYLDRAYTLEGKKPSEVCLHEHPQESYHYTYFDGEHVPSYISAHWRWAQARYQHLKEKKEGFFGDFAMREESVVPTTTYIHLKQLQDLARNPMQEYFTSVLHTLPSKVEDKNKSSEEPLDLSPRDKGLLRKQSITQDVNQILHEAVQKGRMPLSPLKGIFLSTLLPEIEVLQQLLDALQINSENLTTITLSGHAQEPKQLESGAWELPPLILPRPAGGLWKLEGEIPLVATQGLIAYSKANWEDLIKILPVYLTYCVVIDHYHLPYAKNLYPVHHKLKDIVHLEPFFGDAQEQLVQFLNYYEMTRTHPSPLYPKWLPLILKGDADGLQKEIEGSPLQDFDMSDSTVKWLLQGAPPNAHQIIRTWGDVAHDLFSGLKDGWGK